MQRIKIFRSVDIKELENLVNALLARQDVNNAQLAFTHSYDSSEHTSAYLKRDIYCVMVTIDYKL